MSRVRAEEEWARSILTAALDAEVTHHDTGARQSMYDLRIRYPDGRSGAGEVVAAADGESIALWREMNDRDDGRWQVPDLVGGWGVGLSPTARAKRIRSELPRLLKRLENTHLRDLRFASEEELGFAHQLGVSHAVQSGTKFAGSIYITIDLPDERSGGMVPDDISPLVEWVGEFLGSDGQADVLKKLDSSGCDERHAVLFVPSFSTVAYPVMDVLWRDDVELVERPPRLPPQVTDVWVFSSWSTGRVLRWGPRGGWESFAK